jgi:hypothetical protein
MVWGGITATGRTALHVTDGNITAASHRGEILQQHVTFIRNRGNNATLPQDNARPHVAELFVTS